MPSVWAGDPLSPDGIGPAPDEQESQEDEPITRDYDMLMVHFVQPNPPMSLGIIRTGSRVPAVYPITTFHDKVSDWINRDGIDPRIAGCIFQLVCDAVVVTTSTPESRSAAGKSVP